MFFDKSYVKALQVIIPDQTLFKQLLQTGILINIPYPKIKFGVAEDGVSLLTDNTGNSARWQVPIK